MLFAAPRDMQWRKRRLIIAIVSAALIFGMTLVMTGLANGFGVEARNTVDSMGVDTFVVKDGAAGLFLGSTPFPDVDLARIAAEPGVVAAARLACVGTIMRQGTSTRNGTAFGAPEHGPGMPQSLGGQGAVEAGRGHRRDRRRLHSAGVPRAAWCGRRARPDRTSQARHRVNEFRFCVVVRVAFRHRKVGKDGRHGARRAARRIW
jgi:hypothetical protein